MSIDKTLADALAALADSVQCEYPSQNLTCGETDALARVLYAAGYEGKAVSVLFYHAIEDQPGDAHFVMGGDLADSDAVETAMTAYAAGLH